MPIDIERLYKALGLSEMEFAKKLGVGHTAISQAKKRKAFSKQMRTTIKAVFPSVSESYLETGEGEVFVEGIGSTSPPLALEQMFRYDPLGVGVDFVDAMEKAKDILLSDDEALKDALKKSIDIFHRSLEKGKNDP